jgi:hypothetical protein
VKDGEEPEKNGKEATAAKQQKVQQEKNNV